MLSFSIFVSISMRANSFNQLLTKELTRQEFLLHLGLLFLAVSGVSSFLRTLSEPNLANKQPASSRRFGAGPYGG